MPRREHVDRCATGDRVIRTYGKARWGTIESCVPGSISVPVRWDGFTLATWEAVLDLRRLTDLEQLADEAPGSRQ
jgi:hypothetical protein